MNRPSDMQLSKAVERIDTMLREYEEATLMLADFPGDTLPARLQKLIGEWMELQIESNLRKTMSREERIVISGERDVLDTLHPSRPPAFDVGNGHITVGDWCAWTPPPGLGLMAGAEVLVKVTDVLQDGEACIDAGVYGNKMVKWRSLRKYPLGSKL